MTDFEAMSAAAQTAFELARQHVFPGDSALVTELPGLTITGSSFRVEFRLQQDFLGPGVEHDRTMVVLRFVPVDGPVPESPWTLFVRGNWPERTDRLSRGGAKALRRTPSSKQRERGGIRLRDELRNDSLFLVERTHPEDVMAQLCLFVLHTSLSDDSELMPWLEAYLLRRFRFRVRDRRDVARDVVLRLLRNKWWSEDFKGWTKYVARLIQVLERPYLHAFREFNDALSLNRPSGERPVDYRTTENLLVHVIDHPDEEPEPESGIQSGDARCQYDPTGSIFTVEETSYRTNMSLSTLYSMIKRRQIAFEFDRQGRTVIPKSEVERLTRTVRQRDAVRLVETVRECPRATARKRVYRLRIQGKSLDEIVQMFRT